MRRLVPFAFLLVMSCGLSFNDPAEFRLRLYLNRAEESGPLEPSDVERLYLSFWDPADGETDYVLEQAPTSQGPWVTAADYGASAGTNNPQFRDSSFLLELNDQTPPGPVFFRLRSVPAGHLSNLIPFVRKVKPTPLSIVQSYPPCYLRWSAPQAADRVRLERAIVKLDGTTEPPVRVGEFDPTTTSFADVATDGWSDGAVYQYQLFVVLHGVDSEPSTVVSAKAPLLPVITSATLSGGQVTLQYVLNSPWVGSVVVGYESFDNRMYPGFNQLQSVPVTPPGQTATVVLPLPSACTALCAFSVLAEPSPLGVQLGLPRSNWAPERWVFVQPALPSALQPSVIDLHAGERLTRLPDGSFAVYSNGALFLPGRLPTNIPQLYTATPLVSDRLGAVHLLVYVDGRPGTIEHVRYDGQTLQTQVLAQATLGTELQLHLGADGLLIGGWNSSGSLTVVRESAGFVPEPFVTQYPVQSVSFSEDEASVPHLAWVDTSNKVEHSWMDAAGWHTEPVPLSTGTTVIQPASVLALAGRSDQLYFAGQVGSCLSLWLRTSTGWSPVTASQLTSCDASYTGRVSMDGRRFALVDFHGQVQIFGASPTSYGIPYFQTWNSAPSGLGFDATGKFWLAQYLPVDPSRALLFQEP